MKIVKPLLFITFLLVILYGCKPNPLRVDISGIKKNIEVVRFDEELFKADTSQLSNSMAEISNKYPDFFNLFTYKIIRIGGIGDEQFMDLMYRFLTDTMILSVNKLVETEFFDFPEIEKQLQKSFKYFQYHFPEKELPIVYAYTSGFNQSVVTAEKVIGISLDKYLGRNCMYYQNLNSTPHYKIMNMHKEKIVSDVAYAWGITEFEHTNTATNLLGNMIHQGKIMYFVDALLPNQEDSLKIGFTGLQLKWCKNNEAQMWSQLIEHKMLYSNKRMDIIRYINNSPTTSGFPLESPGRTGVWIGWQIVRKYMQKHPEITLPELMNNSDYQQILNDSQYLPE